MESECMLQTTYPKKNTALGFTLIEVMLVCVIVAILVAIALPAYDDYIKRGRIVEGLVPLADMEARMEQYFQDKRTYAGVCEGENTVAPKPDEGKFFTYECSGTASTYIAKAIGINSMAGFQYNLKLEGGKVTRNTTAVQDGWGSPVNCWVRAKGGAC